MSSTPAATQATLFDLPTTPDEISVILTPPALRRINFSALDFQTARRAIVEYVQAYFPDVFNDFIASNGIVMLMEIIAAETAKLSMRADILAQEGFIGTATTEEAVTNIIALIGQSLLRQTPANVDVQCTVNTPNTTDIQIPAGTTLTTNGPDGKPIFYELYRAPGDFDSSITLPAGKRGVIAFGLEGQFHAPVSFTSPGGPAQTFTITDATALAAPIIVTVATGDSSTIWQVTQNPIQQYGSTDEVVEVNFIGSKMVFTFGDDVNGKALLAGQVVSIQYRTGGGVRGRIGVGQLNSNQSIAPMPPANAPTTVTLTNISPSVGGTDAETIDQAKLRAPLAYATHNSIVTDLDYATVASTFAHPVYGAVAKAVATIRTSLNANLVEIYCLALGEGGQLVVPSLGLKQGLATFVSDLNVLTDHVSVLDGVLRSVDVDMTVVVSRTADASVVKAAAAAAITQFFDPSNWSLGKPLFVSNLIDVVQQIPGVSYVDLFSPQDNLLPTGQAAMPGSPGIGFNEIVVPGQQTINYFYDKGRSPIA